MEIKNEYKNYNKRKYKKEINKLNKENKKYYNLVIEDYDNIVKSNDKNIEIYKETIELLKSIGKNDLVIEYYNELIKLNNTNIIEIYKEKIELLKKLADQNNNQIMEIKNEYKKL